MDATQLWRGQPPEVRRALQFAATFSSAIILIPVVMGVLAVSPFSTASGEGIEGVTYSVDMKFVRVDDFTWKNDFSNSTDLDATVSDVSDGMTKTKGFMRSAGFHGLTRYANKGLDISTDDAMFEVMYNSTTLDTDDEVYMNISKDTDEYIAIGNDYTALEFIYTNDAGEQTVALGTFAQYGWYSFVVYFNANYTLDCEVWNADTATLVNSAHITGAKLSSAQNATLLNVTNTVAAGDGTNVYNFEYIFYSAGDTVQDYLQTQQSTSWAPMSPTKEKNAQKILGTSIDAEVGTNWTNASGGWGVVEHALGKVYMGGDARNSTDLLKDNDSAYDLTDIRRIAATIAEENTTYIHEQASTAQISKDGSVETAVLENFRISLFGAADEGAPFIDYRVAHMNITIRWAPALVQSVQETFWKGVETSDADVMALSFSNPLSGIGDGMSGTTGNVMDGMQDGLDGAATNSFGFFGGAFEDSGDLIGSGFAGFGTTVSGVSKSAFQMTNAAIGSMVSGASTFTIQAGKFLVNGVGKLISLPFSLFYAGTSLVKMVFVAFVILIIIGLVGLLYYYRKSHKPTKGGSGTPKIGVFGG